MLQTQTRAPGDLSSKEMDNYLFIEGDIVVGRVEADCCECAWKEGHSRWPRALMALTWSLGELAQFSGICIRWKNRQRRIYGEGLKDPLS